MSLSWYQLEFPSDVTPDAVEHFTRTLVARPRRGLLMTADLLVFELQGADGKLRWRFGVSSRDERQVLTLLRQALPDVHAEPVDGHVRRLPAWELRLSSAFRAMRTDISEQVAGALLAAVRSAARGELVLLQWTVGPWLPRSVVPPASTAKRKADNSVFFDFDRLALDSEQAKALRDKQSEPVFGVIGRIAIQALTPQRTKALRQGVMGALQLTRAPGVGFERRLLPTWWVARRLEQLARPAIAWPSVLNASELAACLGWPIGNPVLPGVTYSGHRHLPPPDGALLPLDRSGSVPRHLRVTGRATYPGQPGLVTLSAQDGLQHVHCLGPTGTGKSTWLASMALQDIAAGRGVVVIDPKRDLVDSIIERIPSERLDDVVVLDPASSAPVGFNPLRSSNPDLAVDGVLHVLHDLYSANWGPRTADVLHNSLATLVRLPGMTLCELVPLLQHSAFRREVVGQVGDDILGVAPFWHWFEQLSEPERTAVVGPVLNKIRSFTTRSAIRAIIGQSTGFDLMDIFTERKILLVSLAKGDLGSDSAHLLGALILGSLWATIQRRSQVAPERRHPVFVYLDEFADVLRLPLDLGDALAQARGLGVGLVLAHQHLGQLSPILRSAVLANARSKVVFQSSHDDASTLAKTLGGGLTPADLQGLRAFETYQALTLNGHTMSPASVATLPLGEPLGNGAAIRRRSTDRYGQERLATDDELRRRRATSGAPDAPIGSRRRRGAS